MNLLDKIHCENCLDTMTKMESKSIDVVITSPPYNMNLRVSGNRYIKREIKKELSSKYGDGNVFEDALPMDEYFETHKEIMTELLRVSKLCFYNIQQITGNKPALYKLIGHFHEQIKELIIWDKEKAQPAMQEGVLNSQFEFIFALTDDKSDAMRRQFKTATFERGTLSNLWKIKPKRSKDKDHSATFPEPLVAKILDNFCDKKSIIYDPFCGTGTSLRIAKSKGHTIIGSEIIESYVKKANTLMSIPLDMFSNF